LPAIAVIKEINSPHIKLMLDIFHLQQIEGNVTRRIKDYMPYVGHVQVTFTWFFFVNKILSVYFFLFKDSTGS